MSKEKLQDIIDNFNPDKFSEFFREKNRSFSRTAENLSQYNDDRFIACTKIGEINFESDNTFFVLIKSKNDLTEKTIKKLQYDKAKQILKDQQADSGIFIFYDSNGSFRFSLVYADYTGKREWSSFKRFTYFVKEGLTNKTFLQQIGDLKFDSLKNIKDAFSVDKVTKEFYRDIANWYFWAVDNSKFPDSAEEIDNGRNIAVIRLITRMIFIWFMKELKLIPENLFQNSFAKDILKDISDNDSSYYKAVLQNLFFATLSTPKEQREFADEAKHQKGHNDDFGNQSVFRFHELFNNPDEIKSYFIDIPYLNGGLFECLDKGKENYYVDGFTRRKPFQPVVPNYLFFSKEHDEDLNKWYGTKGKKYNVKGLLEILSSYNFTVDENTPDDADVALDPELLGKVFENLLASFNPETSTTARKATGSFYTPREIVDYMVSESLKEYFKTHLAETENLDANLENLFNPLNHDNPFIDNSNESKKLVNLIENVRIVDPAVGSGAFPMGILNKLVFILNKIDKGNKLWKEAQVKSVSNIQDSRLREQTINHIENYFENKNPDYGRKLYLIQRCIYGVDIQQTAVEISKLRFFISLLIDEKIDKSKPNWNIEPLPNLDFKIMQGNSLIEEYEGITVFDESLFEDIGTDKINQLNILKRKQESIQKEALALNKEGKYTPELKRKYSKKLEEVSKKIESLKSGKKMTDDKFDMFDIYKETNEKRVKLTKLHKEYYEINDKNTKDKIKKSIEMLEWEFMEATLIAEGEQNKLDELNKIRKSNSKPFFLWKLHFPEVFEKGGFDIVIGNPPYIKEYTYRNAFDGLRNSPYYQGKMDLWYLFSCFGLDILKKNTGLLTFIATNNWTTNSGASKMRKKINSDSMILQLLDFGSYMIFESSDIQTMVMIFKNCNNMTNYSFDYRKLIGFDLNFKDVLDLLYRKNNINCSYLTPSIDRDGADKTLTFNNNNFINILNSLEFKSNYRFDKDEEVAQGIVIPQDSLNKKNQKILGNSFVVGQGIFTLNQNEVNKLKLNKLEKELFKPYYSTRQLKKWYKYSDHEEYIIYTNSKFKKQKTIEPFQNIKRHLDQFQAVITSDNKPYGLHRAREERFFKGEKIIVLRKCAKEPVFTYTDFDCYVSATFYVIQTNKFNLKYLTGLLNSFLIAFWLKNKGKMQGNNYQIDKEPLINIPILKPESDSEQEIENEIINLVDGIIRDINNRNYSNITEKEFKINQLVYKLYRLNDDEIKIIENND